MYYYMMLARMVAGTNRRNAATAAAASLIQRDPSQISTISSQFRAINSSNYYQLLGVSQHATTQDIKTAYYNLAKQYHPDSRHSDYPATKQKFEEISDAYNILCDEQQRAEYDRKLFNKRQQQMCKYNGGRKSDKNSEAPVESVVLPISFMNSVNGARRDVHVTLSIPCPTCKSPKGKHQGHLVNVQCAHCSGTGMTSYANGAYRMQMKCSHCRGNRFTTSEEMRCVDCEGKGTALVQRTIPVTVRAGCGDNEVIRVKHPIESGRFIDVKVKIEQTGHFRRAENDVYSDLMVPFTVAILGGRQEVRDIYGGVHSVQIPPGTAADTTICLAGRGVKSAQTIGNHIVQVKIKIPSRITARQQSLLNSFYVG